MDLKDPNIEKRSTSEILLELYRRRVLREEKGRKALAAGILLPFVWLLEAWVVAKLWTWFVSGPFNVRTIAIFHAFGIDAMVSLATHKLQREKLNPKWEKDPLEMTWDAVSTTLFYLALGWVAHKLMT